MQFKGKLTRVDTSEMMCETATTVLKRISQLRDIEQWKGTLTVPSDVQLHPFLQYDLAAEDGRIIQLTVLGKTAQKGKYNVELNGNLG